ncbi:MAG TPA: ATP-binding protein [Chloroflexota bacterium]|nr:ATP-binding protein [Chloroflexota bacterium]
MALATATGRSEVRSALSRLDLRLRLVVEGQRDTLAERARDPFRGLYISDADVDEILGDAPEQVLAERIYATPIALAAPRLGRLARLFDLDEFEQEVLLIALAPEVDLRYERLYAYLQDDVTRRRPTVDLMLRLLTGTLEESARARFPLGPQGRLIREGLLLPTDDAAGQGPLLSRPLRVDERILEYLLGSDSLDVRLSGFAELVKPDADTVIHDVPGRFPERLARVIDASEAAQGPIIYLHGSAATAKVPTLKTAARLAKRPILFLNVPRLRAAGKPAPATALELAVRESLLQDALLAIEGFDGLLADDESASLARGHLQTILSRHPRPTFLLGEARWEPSAWVPEVSGMRIDLPSLGPSARHQLWGNQLDGAFASDDVADLAARFRLDGDAIRATLVSARLRADWRGDGEVRIQDVREAAAAIAAPPMEGLAKRVEPRYGWNDIVLTADNYAQLKELCDRARHATVVLERWGFGKKHARRSGVTALFAGQPGTGKTMAAEIVAGQLGLELYRIDLSSVVSKYIGETEKNLERIFQAADRGDAVLLFDEADAIFGKRSEVRDAHDRYANVETAYLLQRLEAYDGLAILTTNLRGNIDDAFVRRLEFVLEFPMPEEVERLRIWDLALAPEAPRATDVDLPFLARRFRLAGGHIRNIALGAAFLAAADGEAIGMKHLVRATRREHQKMGKMVGASDFDQYHALLKDESSQESRGPSR